MAHPNNVRLTFRSGSQNFLSCGVTQQGGHPAVIGAGATTALNVTQNGYAGIFTQAFFEHITDIGSSNAVAFTVLGTFSHNHQGVASSSGAPGLQLVAHVFFPAIGRG